MNVLFNDWCSCLRQGSGSNVQHLQSVFFWDGNLDILWFWMGRVSNWDSQLKLWGFPFWFFCSIKYFKLKLVEVDDEEEVEEGGEGGVGELNHFAFMASTRNNPSPPQFQLHSTSSQIDCCSSGRLLDQIDCWDFWMTSTLCQTRWHIWLWWRQLIDGSGKQKQIGRSSKPNSCNFWLPIVRLVPAMRVQIIMSIWGGKTIHLVSVLPNHQLFSSYVK